MPAKKKTASKAKPAAKPRAAAPRARRILLLVGTKKGAWLFHGDPGRRTWKIDGPHLLGSSVNHFVLDPRDGKTMALSAKPGHLGGTIFRSLDGGKTWEESKQPPAFPKAAEGEKGRAVNYTLWLTPGHASEPGVWYAGTSPHGLFRSEDGGITWAGVAGFNDHPDLPKWSGGPDSNPPDAPNTHSILVDPRDPAHLYLGCSAGGVFESLDGGAGWKPLNKGVSAEFLPDPNAEYGHDPHCVVLHPAMPDRLYQQNHCGIYRIDRPADAWIRIGDNMPRDIGDVGFPVVVHPRDPDTAWVVPMDAATVWPRTSPRGKPAVYRTSDAGATWQRLDKGLPKAQAWLTVKRQCFAADASDPVGLYFGTSSGELWMSRDEGRHWEQIAAHLPAVQSVMAVPG